MPRTKFQKYPTTVYLSDGRVFYRAAVIHVDDQAGVYAARKHYPDGNDTRSPTIVQLVTFDGARVVDVEKDVWSIRVADDEVARVAKAGPCACSDPLKSWRP